MSYKAMLEQYEASHEPANGNKKASADMSNYFTTFLEKGVKGDSKKVRILPTKDGSSPFIPIMVHNIQHDGKWRKFVCPKAQKNEPCPFCEARELLNTSAKESDKDLAKLYAPRKMWVVKVIDRKFEQDGPKFWRFNHDSRKTGILDKINGVLQAVGSDITDAQTGRDLLITISRDTKGNAVVSGVNQLDSTPLSTDAETAQRWIDDERTWEDVYSVKNYDYLLIIVTGGIPVWDKEAKKYVDKNKQDQSADDKYDSSENELTIGAPTNYDTAGANQSYGSSNEDHDDLPF